MLKISKQQIKFIKFLQRRAGIADSDYRSMLREMFGKSSCKELTGLEAGDLIVYLQHMAGRVQRKVRPERLTSYQIQLIRAIWSQVSFLPPEYREAGLRAFLMRQCGTENLNWVFRFDGPRIICALKSILKRKNKENNNDSKQQASSEVMERGQQRS